MLLKCFVTCLNPRRLFLLVVLSAAFCSCTTTQSEYSDIVELSGRGLEGAAEKVSFQLVSKPQIFSLSSNSNSAKLEWYECRKISDEQEITEAYFVIFGYKKHAPPCSIPTMQGFGKHGFSVISVTLPNNTDSLGQSSFGGEDELALLEAWFKKIIEGKRLAGFWAFGDAVVPVASLTRKVDVKSVIFGNGIYDLEQVHVTTEDKSLKSDLDRRLAKSEMSGDGFYDTRSVAWDTDGLPKHIFLYHGEDNVRVPLNQAREFKETLEASGHKVELQILGKAGHNISEPVHAAVLERVLSDIDKLRLTGQ